MQIKPDGDFLVKQGEVITVTVTASDTKYLAAISQLSYGGWVVTSPPNVPSGNLREVREFVMQVATNSFDVAYAFLPPPGSAPGSYHINIVGSDAGGAAFDDDILNPGSPVPVVLDYTFVTS